MRKKNALYEVEIKSMALIREGKKSLITYFQGGNKKTIVKNAMKLYPQYTDPKDKPNVNITPISQAEYNARALSGRVAQKGVLLEGRGHIDEIMGC